MAIKERYRDNIGYLYKAVKGSLTTWNDTPIPYRYNTKTVYHKSSNPMAGVYKRETEGGQQTDTQIDFQVGDRVTDAVLPINSAKKTDFSLITNITEEPYMDKGNRYRNTKYVSRVLTFS